MSNHIIMYDRLLELPLFQGISRSDFSHIIAGVKFNLQRYRKGSIIIEDGDTCNRLYFLTNGKIKAETTADDHGYTFIEYMPAPGLIQLERLFGLTQRFTRTFIADTSCGIMTIDKKDVMKLSDDYDIFRLNILNIISTRLQKMERMPWRQQPGDIRQRIIRFFEFHCVRPAGEKHVSIKMETLAKELNNGRLNVSRALNEMQEDGLILLRRGYISIPAMEKLLM